MSEPRYVVGIDLGTTHTALAYVDRREGEAAKVRVLGVPQLVARGTVATRELLPSFLYVAHESDGPQSLPWDAARSFAVGEHARTRGAEQPGRLVSSAKSWLGHTGVDRRGAMLPLGDREIEKVSPVEASFRYLEHLSEAWEAEIARGDGSLALAEQEVILTVPASFDAVARELTAEAAYAAGLENLTLLEEPQAALYAWLDGRGDAWRRDLHPGDLLLVVDVGGGTSDFSAIAVTDDGGSLGLRRVAVGDHILLGGDNMDLALAHVAGEKLRDQGKELDAWQEAALVHAARRAKEQLLGDGAASASVVVPGRGAKLLGGAIKTELTRDDVSALLVDGFFPVVPSSARPAARPRAALTRLGLPYASDAAITRHLAAFLGRQATATDDLQGFAPRGGMLCPTAILFNGGVMKGSAFTARLESVIGDWLAQASAPPARVLGGADLDLGVARGAAAFGLARHGRGLRIRGGTARSYYVGIEGAAPAIPGVAPPVTALCVAPHGMEDGTSVDIAAGEVGLVVGEEVQFRFFASSSRKADEAGATFDVRRATDLDELAPIRVTLPTEGRRVGDVVPVHLRASATEVGTLLLEAVPEAPMAEDERWKIELYVRSDG